MDSLTQIALGAAVTVAVMGRRTAAWKAAAWGAVVGTLPDLDALVQHGDAVLDMVRHRAETHALPIQTLASFPIAWLIARVHGQPFGRWWLAVWLTLVTHALLDAFTVYGTQLLQPFTDTAYGVGSVFIIDPLYTLPLLVGVLAAVLSRQRAGWNTAGLALSSAYLAWSVGAQQWATQQAAQDLAAQGVKPEQLLVTPAPLTTLLWRVVAVDGGHYHEGYVGVLDGERPIHFERHDRGGALLSRHADHPQVQRIARFSDGFYRLREQDGRLRLTDLRMGQEPAYVFDFDIGPAEAAHGALPPAVREGQRIALADGLPWLRARALGADLPPLNRWLAQRDGDPAERDATSSTPTGAPPIRLAAQP
ncbi:metal-dependent hydrolase [Tepidimonas sp.]|mgnify:FL=1|uniref:metal-dependent hydrolase n=1 Tax=Tepidimonas sp. TaxID=2002775 RepID=UPI002FE25E5F